MKTRFLIVSLVVLALTACGTFELSGQFVPAADATATQEANVAITGGESAIDAPTPEPQTPIPTEEPGVLPAPVYYQGTDGQIWRMEKDGQTITQVTNHSQPITFYDVNPVDGSLLYVNAQNELVVAGPFNEEPRVLFSGDNFTEALQGNADTWLLRIQTPRWSPDGRQITFGVGGINIYDMETGQNIRMLENDTIMGEDGRPNRPVRVWRPDVWSPDGQTMLVMGGYYGTEGGEAAFLNIKDGSLTPFSGENLLGVICCEFTFNADGSRLYYASQFYGMLSPGLWAADPISGFASTLISGTPSEGQPGPIQFVASPREHEGKLYYFYASAETIPEFGVVTLNLVRSDLDGISNREVIHSESVSLMEALWGNDASGVLISDGVRLGEGPQDSGDMVWMPVDGSPVIRFSVKGGMLRWGK